MVEKIPIDKVTAVELFNWVLSRDECKRLFNKEVTADELRKEHELV